LRLLHELPPLKGNEFSVRGKLENYLLQIVREYRQELPKNFLDKRVRNVLLLTAELTKVIDEKRHAA
jgi:hypothetical protein